VRGSETRSLLILHLIFFIFATNSVPISAKSNDNAKRPRVVPTLERKLKIIVDFGACKRAVDIGIPPTTARRVVADKQKYKDVK
jgi:hypothetical protein